MEKLKLFEEFSNELNEIMGTYLIYITKDPEAIYVYDRQKQEIDKLENKPIKKGRRFTNDASEFFKKYRGSSIHRVDTKEEINFNIDHDINMSDAENAWNHEEF